MDAWGHGISLLNPKHSDPQLLPWAAALWPPRALDVCLHSSASQTWGTLSSPLAPATQVSVWWLVAGTVSDWAIVLHLFFLSWTYRPEHKCIPECITSPAPKVLGFSHEGQGHGLEVSILSGPSSGPSQSRHPSLRLWPLQDPSIAQSDSTLKRGYHPSQPTTSDCSVL